MHPCTTDVSNPISTFFHNFGEKKLFGREFTQSNVLIIIINNITASIDKVDGAGNKDFESKKGEETL